MSRYAVTLKNTTIGQGAVLSVTSTSVDEAIAYARKLYPMLTVTAVVTEAENIGNEANANAAMVATLHADAQWQMGVRIGTTDRASGLTAAPDDLHQALVTYPNFRRGYEAAMDYRAFYEAKTGQYWVNKDDSY